MRIASRYVQVVCGILSLLFLCSIPLFSQTDAGRILGSVRDQSGAVIVGATVTVTDIRRGTTRTLTTDQAGYYVAPDLPPSLYKVSAELRGFQTVERPNIELEVGIWL